MVSRAISRGTVPDAVFGATTIAGLKADGVVMQEGTPRLVAADDLHGAEQVVTFGLQLPGKLSGGRAH